MHGASLMCRWGAVIICRCADIVPPREMVILVAVLAIGCVEAQVCDPLHSGWGNAGKDCFDHRRVYEHLRSSNDTSSLCRRVATIIIRCAGIVPRRVVLGIGVRLCGGIFRCTGIGQRSWYASPFALLATPTQGRGVAAASSGAQTLACVQGDSPLCWRAAAIIRPCTDIVPCRAMLVVASRSMGLRVRRGQGRRSFVLWVALRKRTLAF